MKILTDFKDSKSFYKCPNLSRKQYDQVLEDKNTKSLDYLGYFWQSQLHEDTCQFPKYYDEKGINSRRYTRQN